MTDAGVFDFACQHEVVACLKGNPESPLTFRDLLDRLAREHERELDQALYKLREENAELRQSFKFGSEKERQLQRAETSDKNDQKTPDLCAVEEDNPLGASLPLSLPGADLPGVLPGSQSLPLSTGDHSDVALTCYDSSWNTQFTGMTVGQQQAVREGLGFAMRDDYKLALPGASPLRASATAGAPSHIAARALTGVELDEDDAVGPRIQMAEGFVARFVSFPGSRYRLAWDVLGGFFILYDLFVIPLRLVFKPPDGTFTDFMDWTTLIFWTLNIPGSLQVGFVRNGVIVMVPRRILRNYIKTWLVVDLIVVVPDWIFSVINLLKTDSSSSAAGEGVKMLKILRLVRTVRLLRLLKLRWILAMLNDLIDSEYLSIFVNIFKMIFLLLSINHFIACLWFLVSDSQQPFTTTWIKEHGFRDSDWDYQYITAFHWSITQFTPSSMHVQPQNILERTFAIAVVVFALVGFSYIVGSITGSLTQLRQMQEDTAKQFWSLRRFLKLNQVPVTLSLRVQKYLEHSWGKRREGLDMANIKIFQLLSDQLRDELKCQISVPPIANVHPLFNHLLNTNEVTMQRLATHAIKRKALARGDKLFFTGEKANYVYFPVNGRFKYIKQSNEFPGDHHEEWVDNHEDWISEAVLWTSAWCHLGTLNAATDGADLLLIDAKEFLPQVKLNPEVHMIVATYAKNFMEWINETSFEDLSDIVQGDIIGYKFEEFVGDHFSKEGFGLLSLNVNLFSGHTRRFPELSTGNKWSAVLDP